MFSLVARVTFLPQFGYAFLRLFPRVFRWIWGNSSLHSNGFKRPSILRGRFLTASRSDAFQDSGGCGKLCAKFQSCVAKRRSQGLERICATFHSVWEVLDCVAKRRMSGLGRMWQALREVPKRAASGPRLKAPRSNFV